MQSGLKSPTGRKMGEEKSKKGYCKQEEDKHFQMWKGGLDQSR